MWLLRRLVWLMGTSWQLCSMFWCQLPMRLDHSFSFSSSIIWLRIVMIIKNILYRRYCDSLKYNSIFGDLVMNLMQFCRHKTCGKAKMVSWWLRLRVRWIKMQSWSEKIFFIFRYIFWWIKWFYLISVQSTTGYRFLWLWCSYRWSRGLYFSICW